MNGKDIADMSRLVKEFLQCFFVLVGLSSNAWQDHIWFERDESDKQAFWRAKMIEKLLLTITIADPQ